MLLLPFTLPLLLSSLFITLSQAQSGSDSSITPTTTDSMVLAQKLATPVSSPIGPASLGSDSTSPTDTTFPGAASTGNSIAGVTPTSSGLAGTVASPTAGGSTSSPTTQPTSNSSAQSSASTKATSTSTSSGNAAAAGMPTNAAALVVGGIGALVVAVM
ncbi:hypothetical protein BC827DRAFT_1157148 [Russula dissimulans]|nr:hypothetical protein BC827DRAFT_1157148 [Russula dissimulans]